MSLVHAEGTTRRKDYWIGIVENGLLLQPLSFPYCTFPAAVKASLLFLLVVRCSTSVLEIAESDCLRRMFGVCGLLVR